MNNLIIEGLWGNDSAKIFTIIISLLFIFSFCFLIFSSKRQWIINKAPALLTTIGLFGTFWGVAVGLGEFEASNID